jgi:cell division transport system permease protein
MDQHLHGLFARALEDEPAPPPGSLAEVAMAQGAALRGRRRRRAGVATGSAAVVAATILALNLGASTPGAPATEAAPAVPGSSGCSATGDIDVFLRPGITDQQRAGLHATLESDPLVRTVVYESQDEAYQRFQRLWQDSPDFQKSVAADQLPASFRITLANAPGRPGFAARMKSRPEVQDVQVEGCAPGVPADGSTPTGTSTEGAE